MKRYVWVIVCCLMLTGCGEKATKSNEIQPASTTKAETEKIVVKEYDGVTEEDILKFLEEEVSLEIDAVYDYNLYEEHYKDNENPTLIEHEFEGDAAFMGMLKNVEILSITATEKDPYPSYSINLLTDIQGDLYKLSKKQELQLNIEVDDKKVKLAFYHREDYKNIFTSEKLYCEPIVAFDEEFFFDGKEYRYALRNSSDNILFDSIIHENSEMKTFNFTHDEVEHIAPTIKSVTPFSTDGNMFITLKNGCKLKCRYSVLFFPFYDKEGLRDKKLEERANPEWKDSNLWEISYLPINMFEEEPRNN